MYKGFVLLRYIKKLLFYSYQKSMFLLSKEDRETLNCSLFIFISSTFQTFRQKNVILLPLWVYANYLD